jgi:microcystin-dependent protein
VPNDIRPPQRGFSFRDFSASKPNQPLPGDRLDTELDRINLTLAQLEAFLLTSFERNGLLKTKFLSETLRQPLQEAQASIGTSISSARIAEDMAYRWANKLDGPVFVPNGGDPVDDGFYSAKFHALRASTAAAAVASQWQDVKDWHFEISTVFYPETKQLHRDFFSTYYGPFDFPPVQDPFGQPPTAGDLYFNTSVGAMFVWDGDTNRWEAFSGAAVASFLDLTDTPKNYTGQANKMLVVGPNADRVLFEDAFRQQQADARFLNLAGGTLTGPLTLPGSPAQPLQATTKAYVDDADTALASWAAAGLASKLALAGGTLTGPLVLPGNPTQSLQAAPKGYVDDKIGEAVAAGIPRGGIIMWSGLLTEIPAGWALCDGGNGRPDLRGRFVVGSGGAYSQNATGGAETVQLTEAQLPAHTHAVDLKTDIEPAHTHKYNLESQWAAVSRSGTVTWAYNSPNNQQTTWDTGVGGAHDHDVKGNTAATGAGQAHENRPPFFALAYIIRL